MGFSRLVLTLGNGDHSGETEDTFIADLAVGLATVMPIPRIKTPVTFASMHIVHDSTWLLASSSNLDV